MNILLTSAGRRTYLVNYFKEALQGVGNVYASNSHFSLALQDADGYLISPLIYDEEYIPSLIKFCKKNNINCIISLFDIDLLVLSKNEKKFLENGIRLILAPEESVRICNDKWLTYTHFKKIGINTPITYLKLEKVESALETGEIKFPLVVKPRWGMASLSTYIVDDIKELHVFYNRAQKEISSSYLKYESSITPSKNIIIQENLVGQEFGLDVLNDFDGSFIDVFVKEKIVMRAGETDIGKTECNSKFLEIAAKLSRSIKQKGILSVDCFQSEKGISVIDLNCRFSGHYPISHLAGINIPQVYINWLMGEKLDKSLIQFHEGMIVTKDLVPRVLTSSKT